MQMKRIKYLDALLGGSHKPVAHGAEADSMDDVACVEHVQTLALGQIPQHSGRILPTGSAERSIWGDSDSIDVAGVPNQVVLPHDLGQRQVPDLDLLVPASGHDHRLSGCG